MLEEDILQEKPDVLNNEEQKIDNWNFLDNYENTIDMRQKQEAANKGDDENGSNDDDDDNNEEDIIERQSMSGNVGDIVFQKDK